MVPSKITVVSSASLERSNVVPEGTATLFKTMVAQAVCDWEADAAPAEPEKVQEVARLTTAASGAGVMAGAVGAAIADAASDAVNAITEKNCISTGNESVRIVKKGLAAWPKCLVFNDRYICL